MTSTMNVFVIGLYIIISIKRAVYILMETRGNIFFVTEV